MNVFYGSCIDFRAGRERRQSHGRYGRRRCSDCRATSPHLPLTATVCFAVFSLLIILLDLVRRRVVHCTRLRTPHPAIRPRCLSRRITRAVDSVDSTGRATPWDQTLATLLQALGLTCAKQSL